MTNKQNTPNALKDNSNASMDYVIIEQDGDGGAYITWVNNLDDYQSIGDGIYIWLKAQDYYNMCQAGVGAG